MLKQDIINAVAEEMPGFLKKDLELALDVMLESILQALTENRRVEIRGFGSFSVRERKARITKNPRTGQTMKIPTRKNIHFTMSKSLKADLID